MDLETFIGMRPEWAQEPCLYIVKQMAMGNTAHRCGASGTHMYRDGDSPYGTPGFTGLLGRMTMYVNYWLPVQGVIYAALRIRKQLVAEGTQRTAVDSQGNTYNIDRGNQTLVLSREKEFHQERKRRENRGPFPPIPEHDMVYWHPKFGRLVVPPSPREGNRAFTNGFPVPPGPPATSPFPQQYPALVPQQNLARL